MVYFVGAGSGAVDLITVRGARLLEQADVIIYAGSLVNPELLNYGRKDCRILNSAEMTLEEVMEAVMQAEREGKMTVRLHTGDPCLYGAVREQMDWMDARGMIDEDQCALAKYYEEAMGVEIKRSPAKEPAICGDRLMPVPAGFSLRYRIIGFFAG